MHNLFSVPFIIVALAMAAASPVWAGDQTNVPLKNWGGFSVFRDPVYDDLERLVTAGLGDRVLLSTKPLSRIEAARIVARAVEKIRTDEAGFWSLRRDLEPVLDRLIEELRPELASLGVKVPGEVGPAPGFFSFLPVDRGRSAAGPPGSACWRESKFVASGVNARPRLPA